MRKNLKWLIAAVAACLLIVAIAIPVMAQDGGVTPSVTPTPTTTPTPTPQADRLRIGAGQAIQDLLGMTREEFREARQAGKSLVQIATEKGYTEQNLIDILVAAEKTSLEIQVAAGKITQTAADTKLAQITEQVKTAINSTTLGPPDWAGKNGNGQNGQRNGPGGMKRGGQRGGGMCDGSGQMNRGGQATPQATTTPTVY